MNKSNIITPLFLVLIASSASAAYAPSTAVNYAVNNYNCHTVQHQIHLLMFQVLVVIALILQIKLYRVDY